MTDGTPQYGRVLDHPCPDCGKRMVLRRSKHGPFYGCTGYPACRAAHGAHPNGDPLGVPADRATRAARVEAHDYFDRLWRGKGAPMSRAEAYAWLGEAMDVDEVHIGQMGEDDCARVVELVERDHPEVL